MGQIDESPKVGRAVKAYPTAIFMVGDKVLAAIEGCPPSSDAVVEAAKKAFSLKDK